MNFTDLKSLLFCLEYGSKIHISVVFLDNHGNKMTALPQYYYMHSSPVCEYFKHEQGREELCIRCRNYVLKKAVSRRKDIRGICCNGIYEYCHPVVIDGSVVCVIFIGNILPASTERSPNLPEDSFLWGTMEKDFNRNLFEEIASVAESYIYFLLKNFRDGTRNDFSPLIVNIKNYIEENLFYDFKMRDFSEIFNYNEKYLGKLFKAKTGTSIREYVNIRRIEKASELLESSDCSITEISLKTGYNNVSYFNRTFKRLKGETPSQFRSSL